MSSNLRIIKICAYCKQEFIARKTTTETCSDACAKRFYKVKQREKAVQRIEVETVVKKEPSAFITEGEIKAKWNKCSIDQLELFLFQFGRNLKPSIS